MQANGAGQIILQQANGDSIAFNNTQIVDILKHQQDKLKNNEEIFNSMKQELDKRGSYIQYLQQVIQHLQKENAELKEKIDQKTSSPENIKLSINE